jgi:hypothetical protein
VTNAQAEQGKELGQVNQTLRFSSLFKGQSDTTVLLIKQILQARLNGIRQPESRHFRRHLNGRH